LGAYETGTWTAATVRLEPGDQLVLYTDGVTDSVGRHERFGERRLADALCDVCDAEDTIRKIERALTRFEQGPRADDTAVLAVQRRADAAVGIGGGGYTRAHA
jgi:serine phosphatase RsbU (regulator of sigma subunit)